MATRAFNVNVLDSGRVYRTSEFNAFTANPARLVDSLEKKGVLRQLAHGLYTRSERTKFGGVRRPDDDELLRGFLGDDNFVVTGSDAWNQLGLGSKAVLATPLVYSHQRSGEEVLDGRRFLFKRSKFPRSPSPEWYVVDLLDNHKTAQLGLDDALNSLVRALQKKRFSPALLARAASEYGNQSTRSLVFRALGLAGMKVQGFARSAEPAR